MDEYLKTKKDDITKCQGLFRKDIKLLYPADGASPKDFLENLDLTLLAVIIKVFSVFKPSIKKGWDNAPETDDTDSVSDIVRLRIMRNELYHSSLWAITNEMFEQMWTTLTDALIRLGAVDDSIHDVRAYCFTHPREQHKAYTEIITEQFSRDKDSIRKFIENNRNHLQKENKMEVHKKLMSELMAYHSGICFGHKRATRYMQPVASEGTVPVREGCRRRFNSA